MLSVAKGLAPVVGRQGELTRLDELLDALTVGPTTVVQLVGEPGIGKTRLVQELLERARERGQIALSGRASEFERDVPFAAWIDALDEHLKRVPKRELRALPGGYLRELAAVFPALAPDPGQHSPALPAERYQLHRAFAALLERLARDEGLVLALDDVHWADAASIEVLLHLIERPPAGSILLALAYRPRQLPHGVARALEDLGERGMVRLELSALRWEEAEELVPDQLPGDVRERLYRDSGGNPFYLEQLVRSLERGEGRTSVAARSAGDGFVPSAVAAATEREIGALPKHVRTVLEGAAVAGDPFEPDIAAAAAAVEADQMLAGVAELVGVRPVPPPKTLGRFPF